MLRILTLKMRALLFALLLVTASAEAQVTLPEMERVLLPISVRDVGGAFGTRWSTDLTMYMDADLPPLVVPFTGCYSQPCDDAGGPTSRRTLTLGFLATAPGDTTGSLLHIAQSGADSVSLALTLRRSADDVGIAVPVVREREFSSRPLQLLDVPNPGPAKRMALRIYGIDPDLLGVVRVRIYRAGTEQLLSDQTYSLTVAQKYFATASFRLPVRPPVSEVHYWSSLTPGNERLRFQIEPVTPGLRLWAFISVTDNVTQEVSLRLP